MEWTEILLALLSGTTVASVVEVIRFRKQNKELKTIEVKKADVESQPLAPFQRTGCRERQRSIINMQ